MISKSRLNELVMEVCKEHRLIDIFTEMGWVEFEHYQLDPQELKNFAHLFAKALEQESGVVGWICNGRLFEVEQHRLTINGGGVFPNQFKVTALPLVEGD